ncbi:MAG: DUF6273 domain-containing protein [Christensenellales bacterium]|nr:DUF6273 domain-containing protein [Christensenellales bacterium]
MKRWIGALLAACLVMALLPTAALAAGTGKAIQRVSSASADNISGGQADNVYFGNYFQSNGSAKDPVKWRVLSNTDGQLFLLSDQNLDVFQYHTEEEIVTWETSTMRSWLNGYGASSNSGGSSGIDYTEDNFLDAAFSAKEQNAIVETAVVNNDNKDEDYGTNGDGGNDTPDRIFLLSLVETSNRNYFPRYNYISTNTAYVAGGGELGKSMNGAGEPDWWWLRSPGDSNLKAAFVEYEGAAPVFEGQPVDYKGTAVRPAFNLNLSSVLFTSAATGGKSSGTDTGLATVADYTDNEWKLTLLDSSRNFTVSGESWDGNTLTFSYAGAQAGTNEYISAVIEDNGVITYYGRILQLDGTTNGASGKANLSLPSGVPLSDTTKLYVFNEQCNGDYKTDYASELKNIFPAPAQAPSITTTSLSGGKVGEAYSQTLAATGTTPITWALGSGSSLPAGLTLSGGTISGTPTTAGTFTFTVKATNSAGSDTQELSIVIQAASVGPNPDPNPNPNPNPNYNQRPVIIIPTTDQNVSASVGNTVTMHITANYAQSYQWYVDTGSGFNAIPGATGAAYTTSQVALGNNGYRYYCVARNAYGTAVSPVFTLNVLEYMGIPATGDSPQAGLWIGFAMVSFAGLAACAALWRRKRTN